jgi:hypothetical protein
MIFRPCEDRTQYRRPIFIPWEKEDNYNIIYKY